MRGNKETRYNTYMLGERERERERKEKEKNIRKFVAYFSNVLKSQSLSLCTIRKAINISFFFFS